MKAIVAILFVCLATGANGGPFSKLNPFSSNSKGDYDLKGLEKWLEKRTRGDDIKDGGLGLLRNNVGQFKSTQLENTAQLVLDVANLKECNQQVLVKLNELARADVVRRGHKRTEEILSGPLRALYNICGKYVDETLAAFNENSLDDGQRQFIKLIHETDLWQVAGGFVLKAELIAGRIYKTHDGRPSIWGNFFFRLARDVTRSRVKETVLNKQTKLDETTYHRDRFDHAMKDYLLPSCESFLAIAKDKFDFAALEGLASLRGMPSNNKLWLDFMTDRPIAVQRLASSYYFCSFAPQLSKDNFDSVFEMLKQAE